MWCIFWPTIALLHPDCIVETNILISTCREKFPLRKGPFSMERRTPVPPSRIFSTFQIGKIGAKTQKTFGARTTEKNQMPILRLN